MKELWERLEAHLARHAPQTLDSLNPPATAERVARAESLLRRRLPSDLVESLMVHDGQPGETGHPPHPVPLVPTMYNTEHGDYIATFGELASLDHIVSSTLRARRVVRWTSLAARLLPPLRPTVDGPVRASGSDWIVFVDSGSGDQLALDLHPLAEGNLGQVVAVDHDPPAHRVLAASYRGWFENLVQRYESGRYVIVEQDGVWGAHDELGPERDA